MIQLKNINQDFNVNIGDIACTIRLGFKWSYYNIDTPISLWNCSFPHTGYCTEQTCSLCGEGIIIGHWCGAFADIPKSLLAIVDNINARNFNTLLEILKINYGHVTKKDNVTALIYLRTN